MIINHNKIVKIRRNPRKDYKYTKRKINGRDHITKVSSYLHHHQIIIFPIPSLSLSLSPPLSLLTIAFQPIRIQSPFDRRLLFSLGFLLALDIFSLSLLGFLVSIVRALEGLAHPLRLGFGSVCDWSRVGIYFLADGNLS